MTKVCTGCGEEKGLEEFTRDSKAKDGLAYRCKACGAKHALQYMKTPEAREKRREAERKRIASMTSEQRRLMNLRKDYSRCYSLTVEQRQAMFESQNGLCAICGKPEGQLHTDHQPLPGEIWKRKGPKKVRGLLCRGCNHGIGNFKDNPELLQKAIDYLRLHMELSCSIFENGAAPV